MPDPFRRKQLEYRLQALLRVAEEKTLNDPEIQTMVQRVRENYQSDQQGFMAAMGMGGSPRGGAQPVPPSRIPQLLLLLDSLGPHRTDSPPQLSNKIQTGAIPPLLPNSKQGAGSGGGALESPNREPAGIAGINREMLEETERDIQETAVTLRFARQEEPKIRSRSGKYAIPAERLKAERVLREYPERLRQLTRKKQLILDGVLR